MRPFCPTDLTILSMKTVRFVVTVFVILFANTLAVQSAEPERLAKPSIAILDFVMQGERPAVDNWAVGLADFVAMRFHERGVATLERQHLGYVLSERQLQQSGLVKTEDVIRSQLPWVKYLVKGTIASLSGSEFAIGISVVDAKSTSLVARHRATGVYPEGLSDTLDRLVGKIVGSSSSQYK